MRSPRMTSQKTAKLNQVFQRWPKGTIATQTWLNQLGISSKLANWHVEGRRGTREKRDGHKKISKLPSIRKHYRSRFTSLNSKSFQERALPYFFLTGIRSGVMPLVSLCNSMGIKDNDRFEFLSQEAGIDEKNFYSPMGDTASE
jgi:hypothetical protein